jgi:hypothetical protein
MTCTKCGDPAVGTASNDLPYCHNCVNWREERLGYQQQAEALKRALLSQFTLDQMHEILRGRSAEPTVSTLANSQIPAIF